MKDTYFQFSRLVLLILLMSFQGMQAQERKQPIQASLNVLITPVSTKDWMTFKENVQINGQMIFDQHKVAFGLRNNDQMRLTQSIEDDLGFTHHRYQQYYKGHKVEGAVFLIHDLNGQSRSANGILLNGLDMDTKVNISSEEAIQLALMQVNAEVYMWENTKREQQLKEKNGDSSASYYPKPELLWASKSIGKGMLNDNFELAYKVDIYTFEPMDGKAVYIDAKTGNILKEVSLFHSCTATSGETIWNGERTFYASQNSHSSYILKDDCTDAIIHTRKWSGDDYIDATNTWITPGRRQGLSAHWAARKALDYYLAVHDRKSWNDAWADINVYTKEDLNNASWSWHYLNGNSMVFGLANTNWSLDDYYTIDIVGHEFTHGVTGASAGLIYEGEPGALNESFSDIFGCMVERYVEGDDFDWAIGEDRGNSSRNLANPKILNHPDTYKGDNWYEGDQDNGGVHTNSGVQNYWFYLLSMGGSGVNDNGYAYQIEGIGTNKAGRIAYRTLTNYLTLIADYSTVRKASIKAAKDLYGDCSFEAQQVSKAWYAVGVGQEHKEVCGNIFPQLFNKVFEGGESLTAGGTNCTTTIYGNSSYTTWVTFKAGQYISLKPGFKSKKGSRFRAFTDDCAWIQTRQAEEGEVFDQEINQSEMESLRTGQVISLESVALSVYPNPFDQQTTIEYQLHKSAEVSLLIRNTLGQIVEKPVHKEQKYAGKYRYEFQANDLPNGMYFCTLKVGNQQFVKKMVLAR